MKMRSTLAVLVVVSAVGLLGCPPPTPLEGRPCPCADGYVCCEATQRCVAELTVCAAKEAAAAGVSVVRAAHYVTPNGVVDIPVGLGTTPLKAWTLEGSTFTPRAVTVVDGGFELDVPAGATYYVQSGTSVVVTAARSLDLGSYLQGRPDTFPLNGDPTSIVVSATGLSPWQASDTLQLATESVFELADLSPVNAVTPGSTALIGAAFSYASIVNNSLQASRGDVAVLSQTRTELYGPDGGYGSAISLVASARTPPLTTAANQSTSISVSMVPVTQKTVTADLRPSKFKDLTAQVHPAAVHSPALLAITAVPGGLSRGFIGYLSDLLSFPLDTLPDGVYPVRYGNPVASWGEVAGISTSYTVPIQLPGANPGTFSVYAGTSGSSATLFAQPLEPRMGPPGALALDGQDARAGASVLTSGTPRVSWTAPSTGSPTHYRVRIRELSVTLNKTRAQGTAATFVVAATELRIPPGLLQSGRSYVLAVAATDASGGSYSFVSAPFYDSLDEHSAEAASSQFRVP
jgi:hypothetical protein